MPDFSKTKITPALKSAPRRRPFPSACSPGTWAVACCKGPLGCTGLHPEHHIKATAHQTHGQPCRCCQCSIVTATVTLPVGTISGMKALSVVFVPWVSAHFQALEELNKIRVSQNTDRHEDIVPANHMPLHLAKQS